MFITKKHRKKKKTKPEETRCQACRKEGGREGGRLDSAAMKTKVRERWDNVTLRLFKSKLNEIHLDSQTSQVITGGDSFFFFFPGDWFLTRRRKAWKSLSQNHFQLRLIGGRWRKWRWGWPRAIHHHALIYFSPFLWTDFLLFTSRKRNCSDEQTHVAAIQKYPVVMTE